MKEDILIKAENLKKSYGKGDNITEILHGINITIHHGEYVAIMGPSGSGKSTLMNILGLLDVATSGNYIFNGHDISKYSDSELSHFRAGEIGFVFQSFHLLPKLTVFQNVMLPLIYSGVKPDERRQKVINALKSVDLPEDRWAHHPNEISGGQMQRVAIARALVHSPSLVLADEPTGNLDTKTGNIVLETFAKIHALDNTIVMITHEEDVAEHADRIIKIRDGLVESDLPNKRKTRV